MKRLLFVLFVLSGSVLFAQNTDSTSPVKSCEDLVIQKYDKVTGKTDVYGKPMYINNSDEKGGIVINLIKRSKKIDFVISIGNVCVDDSDKINILFRDGSRLELENQAEYNCTGIHMQVLGGNRRRREILKEFVEKEIEILRVHTRTSYIERSFKHAESVQFQKTLQCLTEI